MQIGFQNNLVLSYSRVESYQKPNDIISQQDPVFQSNKYIFNLDTVT